ncbi:TetR/AcrR family transcriptional regulator [Bacillus alveayuensis]|uniref:TetR/AcrR family transcriptional regulator n=1 Tax=Aeribacillus alveayuensis TaxID=279215 RepID=UPI0005D11F57|nr:TetR/AcrR family transcriptional regulator [Bacillus alveayuensis]
MNQKKKQILETAMKLFAQKGFHATSMQEIAEQCGIAKGSIYNYFPSKDELLLSIFRYYSDAFTEKISLISQERGLSPKEAFQKQLYIQLQEFVRYRDFIQMYMREQMFERKEEIKQFMTNMRKEILHWYQRRLIELYGEDVRPYSLDCAIMINGMMKEYIIYMIFDKKKLDIARLANYIFHRIEDFLEGVQKRGEVFFTDEVLLGESSAEPSLSELIAQYRTFIQSLEITEEVRCQALDTLDALEEQLDGDEIAGRKVVVQSLLLFLENLRITQGDMLLKKIKEGINSKCNK